MNTTISTPVTYKLFFEWHGGFTSHPHTYYSLATAIHWYQYFEDKLRGEYVIHLYAYKGDIELQEVNVNNLCEA